jgi:hypothetical protein
MTFCDDIIFQKLEKVTGDLPEEAKILKIFFNERCI